MVVALGRDGLEEVGHPNDPRSQRYLLSLEPPRVAAAVYLFVVRAGDGRDLPVDALEADLAKDPLGLLRVNLHQLPLPWVQPSGLAQDRVRHCELAVVVQERCCRNHLALLWRKPELVADSLRVLRDLLRVAPGQRIACVDAGGQPVQDGAELTVLGFQKLLVAQTDADHGGHADQQATIGLDQGPLGLDVVHHQNADRFPIAHDGAADEGLRAQFLGI